MTKYKLRGDTSGIDTYTLWHAYYPRSTKKETFSASCRCWWACSPTLRIGRVGKLLSSRRVPEPAAKASRSILRSRRYLGSCALIRQIWSQNRLLKHTDAKGMQNQMFWVRTASRRELPRELTRWGGPSSPRLRRRRRCF